MDNDELKELLKERYSLIGENTSINGRMGSLKRGSKIRHDLVKVLMRNNERLSQINIIVKENGEHIPKERHIVSDHALVRYLERVHEIDVEALKNNMLKGLDQVDMGTVTKDEIQYIFYNGNLVTVIPEKWVK